MEVWRTIPLDDVVTIKGGGTPSTDVPAYWQGDIPWVSPKDMKFDEIASSQDTISRHAVENSATNMIPEGSVLVVTRSGILARTIPIGLTVRDLTVNQDIKALCPKSGIDSRFLFYFLRSSEPDLLKRVTRGATVHRLSTDDIRSLPFPDVPLPEQRRIVAILDEAFEGIGKAIANTEKNLANARELFEAQLAHSIHQQAGDAEHLYLMDVCIDFGRGKSKHRPRNDPKLYGGPYPFIQTGDLSGANDIIQSFSQSYSEVGLAQSKLWPKGTVCIAIVGATIGESGILGFDACFPDSVIGMVAHPSKTTPQYLQYLLRAYKAVIKSKGEGSARENINLGTFEQQQFPFPTIAQQREIAGSLGALAETAVRLEDIAGQKLRLFNELKTALLARAFSGQLQSDHNLAEAAE
jgi:type I restriction enzyme, S subunit